MENEKLVETVAKHGVEIENIKEDIDELKDTSKMIYEMNSNIKIIAEKIGDTNSEITDMKKDIKELKVDMDEVKCKPDKENSKKYKEIVKYITTAILGAIVALVLKQIGLL